MGKAWREKSIPYSEAIVIIFDESQYLVERCETLKYSILEHSVELVLNTSQNRILFVDIEA